MNRKHWIYVVLALALTACSQVRHSYNPDTNFSKVLLTRIKDPVQKDSMVLKRKGEIQVYKSVFKEYQVEKGNVIEYSLMPENTGEERVRYQEFKGYWHEIYLMRVPGTGGVKDAFILFSAKFRSEADGNNWKKVCIGFGPAYAGREANYQGNFIIHFEKELKMYKTSGHFQLKSHGSADLKFILSEEATGNEFKVTKVVQLKKNKIGGEKPLAFDVANVFGSDQALAFTRMETLK